MQPRFTILILDDDETLRYVLREALTQSGHCVVGAADGEDALAWLAANRPDLILFDLKMPGMDGNGFIEAVRSQARLSHVSILLLSAVADLELQAGQLGVDLWMAKPFDLLELLDIVEQVLRRP